MVYKVMIVDDSVMMRNVTRSIVSKWANFEVVANAENGKKALEQLDKYKDLSLILLDIEMPEMDGLEFLRLARLRTKAKIVILSSVAIAGSPYAAKARMLGADAIITKPSGAVSLDLAEKRGVEMQQTIKKVLGI
jgi:two-component system chemotaxis response regulator CheB/two-component system chemotaxis response regulator CheY